MDCRTGPSSFCHVNVSGGEFCEVQDNVREEPTPTVTVDEDVDGVLITGAAVWTDETWLSEDIYI